jgi:shikimate dehydrogenase
MYPNNGERVIDLSRFKKLSGVLDLIYNPIRTRLILDALSLGIPASGGLSMLVAQAVYANGHFFKKKLPCEKIEEVLCKIEKSVSNISLIGMPGCGKSTVGRSLADMLGNGDINSSVAKKVLKELYASDCDPYAYVKENSLGQINDDETLRSVAKEAVINNPKMVADFKSGKVVAFKSIMGQCMQKTGGKGNPVKLTQFVEEEIAKL